MLRRSIGAPRFKDDMYGAFKEIFASSQRLEFMLTFIPGIRRELWGKLKRSRAESTNDVAGVAAITISQGTLWPLVVAAVASLHQDMAARHRAHFRSIQVRQICPIA
jgi:hypothetical protein